MSGRPEEQAEPQTSGWRGAFSGRRRSRSLMTEEIASADPGANAISDESLDDDPERSSDAGGAVEDGTAEGPEATGGEVEDVEIVDGRDGDEGDDRPDVVPDDVEADDAVAAGARRDEASEGPLGDGDADDVAGYDGSTAGEEVRGDRFVAVFPTRPAVEVVEVPLERGVSTTATIYRSAIADGDALLALSHVDTPGGDADVDEAQALRDSAFGTAENTGGEVVELQLVDLLGRVGVDYAVMVPGGGLRGMAFFDGARLYTGQLVADGGIPDRAPLDDLMASVRLTH